MTGRVWLMETPCFEDCRFQIADFELKDKTLWVFQFEICNLKSAILPVQDTGHGSTFQMWAAYSEIVRSLENFPEEPTLMIALRAQACGSWYSSPTWDWVRT